MNRITLFILCLFISHAIEAQLNAGGYEGFSVTDNKNNSIPDLISIQVAKHTSSQTTRFTTNKEKPLNGKYHIIINPNKYVIAHFADGFANGDWTLYSYNKEEEKLFLKKGKYEGEQHEYHHGHTITTYKDGIIQHQIAYYPNGNLKVERSYENGKLHGDIKEYREDGSLKKETQYQQGEIEGKYLETNEAGYTWIKHHINGKLVGEYLEIAENGTVTKKGYYNDKSEKTGRWTSHDEDGTIQEDIGYLDGKLHGEKRTYTDGHLYSLTEYEHGKYSGKDLEYYSSIDQLRTEKNYADNQLEGPTKYYNNEGILYKEILYRKGKKVLEKTFDNKSGVLHQESTFKDGITVQRKIYKNGQLAVLQLVDEKGSLVDVQEYNTAGKVTKTNTSYKKSPSIKLKEDASGIIDIEFE